MDLGAWIGVCIVTSADFLPMSCMHACFDFLNGFTSAGRFMLEIPWSCVISLRSLGWKHRDCDFLHPLRLGWGGWGGFGRDGAWLGSFGMKINHVISFSLFRICGDGKLASRA